MTKTTSATQTTTYDPLIGVEVVVLRPADFTGFTDVLPRGARFRVTAGLIEATLDRRGVSWLRFLDDADAQERAFGEQVIARADDQAEPIREWQYGDALWEKLYTDRRRTIIATTADGSQERREAFRALEFEFGEPKPTSTILSVVAGDDGTPALAR